MKVGNKVIVYKGLWKGEFGVIKEVYENVNRVKVECEDGKELSIEIKDLKEV